MVAGAISGSNTWYSHEINIAITVLALSVLPRVYDEHARTIASMEDTVILIYYAICISGHKLILLVHEGFFFTWSRQVVDIQYLLLIILNIMKWLQYKI